MKSKPIYKLSRHDRKVYQIANKYLKEGWEKVGIGEHIESCSKMVELLKKRYPNQIVYVNNQGLSV